MIYSDGQWALAAKEEPPPPCRDCWAWTNGKPPVFLGYQLCSKYDVYVRRCLKCYEKTETFEWIIAIPPPVFDAFVDAHPQGFTPETLWSLFDFRTCAR